MFRNKQEGTPAHTGQCTTQAPEGQERGEGSERMSEERTAEAKPSKLIKNVIYGKLRETR